MEKILLRISDESGIYDDKISFIYNNMYDIAMNVCLDGDNLLDI